ncbi:ComEC/Rec2 family competence protein [Ruminiclostridium sufflavum]|uniref:ComEC/Rec2 family competence protein n=1 Tax=Ruminiclostridium sufflavum TaxID=396504 RepID=UPI001401F11F|nr:MBL fold metallo-hydrolase [Ruminiclostridium sufflavum]
MKLYNKIRKVNIVLICTVAIISIAGGISGCGKENLYLKMDILDTGKSDCIILQIGDKVIVNDSADEDDHKLIASVLDDYGIKNIDYFIISHYDNDHIGSASNIIKKYKVGRIFAPDYKRDSKLYSKLMKAVNSARVPVSFLTEDYTIETANGHVQINAPLKKVYDNENNYSLITSVYCKGYSLLLCGDALEQRMQEFNSVCKDSYTFIKLPHHGSYDSGLKAALNNAKPLYAAVTAESKKRLDSALLSELNALGTRLYKSYDGRIMVTVTDRGFNVEQ